MSHPDRGVFTDWLLTHVRAEFTATDISPEDKEGMEDFGWQSDMHAEGSVFNPYVVITPQTATSSPGSIGAPDADWQLPYLVTCYGVDRRQTEDLADDVRNHISGNHRADVLMKDQETSWQVTHIQCHAIGGIGYNGQVDPRMYSQTDSYTMRISRRI